VFAVVPTASKEAKVKEVRERSGAEKGVEETGCEEGPRRSWVYK